MRETLEKLKVNGFNNIFYKEGPEKELFSCILCKKEIKWNHYYYRRLYENYCENCFSDIEQKHGSKTLKEYMEEKIKLLKGKSNESNML